MKFVINTCYGGFSLSKEALDMVGIKHPWECKRNDAELIEAIEVLGEQANGSYSKLTIVEVPNEATDWELDEYDGLERLRYVLDGKIRYAEADADDEDWDDGFED